MILGSGIGSVITPFARAFAWVLAGYYSFTHNYGLAIIMLTLTVMVVVFPLTRRGTRSMMRMQLLAPELSKIRERYKRDKGQSATERQEAQKALNEEMMALYRANGVSPTGGCLPTFMQFPIFIVLYDVIRGMTKVRTIGTGIHKQIVSAPQYLSHSTALYRNLIHSGGKMEAFGLNLADSVRTHQHAWFNVAPYVVVILIAVALQYVSIWQITNRNPAAAQANPQMQAIQKFMPIIFVFLYIVLPAGVGLYFIVSSAFRIAQQEYMYKHDKHIVAAVEKLRDRKPIDTKATENLGVRKGFRDRMKELAAQTGPSASLEPSPQAKNPRPGPGANRQAGGGTTRPRAGTDGAAKTQGGPNRPKPGTNRPNQSKAASNGRPSGDQQKGQPTKGSTNGSGASKTPRTTPAAGTGGTPASKPPPPRSQSKRPRRPR
jgi:YidC/Oxa1 family membrane protein insertase